jgi:lysophospholipase L1-like esterase
MGSLQSLETSAPESVRPRRPVRLRTKLLVLAISTALSLAAAELVLRQVAPPILGSVGTLRVPKAKLYGWAMPPNFRHRFVDPDTHGFLYASTNSEGWKDVEHSFAKPAGTVRILFLGDSFTWGFVPLEDLYTRKVEVLLKDQGHPTVEVLSIGIGSWGTDQSLEALIHEGVRYNPDVVIYQFCANDVLDNITARNKPFRYDLDKLGKLHRAEVPLPDADNAEVSPLKDFIHSSALVSNANQIRTAIGNWFDGGRADQETRQKAQFVEDLMLDPTGPYFLCAPASRPDSAELKNAWQLTEALVEKLNEVARAHDAAFAVFSASCCAGEQEWQLRQNHFQHDQDRYYATRDGKRYPADLSRPVERLQAICERRNISFIPQRRAYPRFKNDPHLNPAGNQSLAEDISEFLESWPPFQERLTKTKARS